jgi:predicted RNase H-related nuclease YkuK (DUF458 family)
MKRLTHLLIMVSLVSFAALGIASAYEPAVQWQKTFGGSSLDFGWSVQQTTDRGYIIAGTTGSFGRGDVYLIKTDSAGNKLWQKTFVGSKSDYGSSAQQTTDGGYIIAGTTYSFGAGQDVYLIKTDSDGNSVWQRTFGGSGDDRGYSVGQTIDGGYIIAGGTESFGAGSADVYLIKTDPNGNSVWQKTFGGNNWDDSMAVQQTSDGGFIIAGYTYSFGSGARDVYLIKTDPNGDSQWQRTFGGKNDDQCWSVQQTVDSGYIIAGWTRSFGSGKADVYFIKTDPNGNQEWQKTFGGNNDDWGLSVRQTFDNGYIIAGYTWSFGAGASDVYLIKTDSGGNLLWQKTLGGSNSDDGRSVQQTYDGGYIIAGTTSSFGVESFDVYLIKLSADVCQYVLLGDVNSDCKVDFYDFALMAANWLIDCNINPSDPACIPK